MPSGQHWLTVQGLEPETAYQFSVLAQNKLGTGPFSEVVTVNTLGWQPIASITIRSTVQHPSVISSLCEHDLSADASASERLDDLCFALLFCSSISYKYSRTTGAAYPTTVPHSQPDTAGSPTHMDPSSQSHVAN